MSRIVDANIRALSFEQSFVRAAQSCEGELTDVVSLLQSTKGTGKRAGLVAASNFSFWSS